MLVTALAVSNVWWAYRHQSSVESCTDQEGSTTELLSVRLDRSDCFVQCPVYSVVAFKDGSIAFNGIKNVRARGTHEAKLTHRDFLFLAAAVRQLDFVSLRERYSLPEDGCKELWTDQPMLRIAVTSGSGTKSVAYYTGCKGPSVPSRLGWLADTIDELTATSQWIDVQNDSP